MPTVRQKRAIDKVVENGGNVSRAMIDVGYSPATAKTPQKLTESKAWKELMDNLLSDEALATAHAKLLNSHSIEHMVFPLLITDEEIKEPLASVNCEVRKFMHSETQTHVWFWTPDNKARKDALDMAYKLKGRYPKHADESDGSRSSVFNILAFVQNGTPRIVTTEPERAPGASGDSGQAERQVLEVKQSIFDQR